MEPQTTKPESKHGGVTNKGSLYAHASVYGTEVIDFLMITVRNEKVQMSVRVSAANKLLDKMLANLSENDVKVSGNYTVNIDGLIGLSTSPAETTDSDPATPESSN